MICHGSISGTRAGLLRTCEANSGSVDCIVCSVLMLRHVDLSSCR